MRSTSILSVLALAGLSFAQNGTDGVYTIDPDNVPKSTRDAWCTNQQTQCPLICLQLPGVTTSTTQANDCDADNLTYDCVCDNGVSPNVTQYSQTLPYYICTEWGNECVSACGTDNSCSNDCRANHPCGAQHPNAPNSSALSTMSATASQTGAASKVPVTGFGGASSTSSAKGGAVTVRPLFEMGQAYGLVLVLGSVFAGFAILL